VLFLKLNSPDLKERVPLCEEPTTLEPVQTKPLFFVLIFPIMINEVVPL